MMFGKNGRSNRIKVLLIDPNGHHMNVMSTILQNSKIVKFEIEHASTLDHGFKLFEKRYHDVVILNPEMAEAFGLRSVRMVLEKIKDSPLLLLTGIDDEKMAFDAVKEGAQDCLILGRVGDDSIIRSLIYAIERQKYRNSATSNNIVKLEQMMKGFTDG